MDKTSAAASRASTSLPSDAVKTTMRTVADMSSSLSTTPLLPRWYPTWRGKPWYRGNVEALAWSLDAVGRAVTFVSVGAFFSVSLLRCAKLSAGCAVESVNEDEPIPECTLTVYGIRPSSLLALYTVAVGLISSIAMPLMGAIIDYTENRRLVGQWTSVLFVATLIPLIFISEDNWFIMANLLIVVALIGWVQTLVTYAYLPELSNSEEELNEFTQGFTITSFGSMVIFLLLIVGITSAAGYADDDIVVTEFGLSFAVAVSACTLYPAWFRLFKPRPAAHVLPEGQSLWTSGFVQVYRTGKHIIKHLPALKWFYASVSLVDAGVNSLAAISMTYMVDTLALSSTETGFAIISLLIGSIPGAFLAGYVNQRWNPIRSTTLATILIAATTIMAALTLTKGGQQLETYIFALLWGVSAGWKWTSDRVAASTLIPHGQDAELMGIYLFCGQILTWLPPLIFTVMNENGISQQIGLGSLSIWFVLGALCLLMVGNYDDAVAMAGRQGEEQPRSSSEDNGDDCQKQTAVVSVEEKPVDEDFVA